MSDLIAVAFGDRTKAQNVLDEMKRMQREHLVDLEDACIVERGDDGQVKLHQSVNLTRTLALSGGASGALWGTLIGVLLLNPLAGLATGAGVGAGAGALHGHLTDYGIDDTFMHGLSEQLQPGSSALFVLARSISADKVTDELSRFEGKVLRTSLSDTQERKLREALESQADNQAA